MENSFANTNKYYQVSREDNGNMSFDFKSVSVGFLKIAPLAYMIALIGGFIFGFVFFILMLGASSSALVSALFGGGVVGVGALVLMIKGMTKEDQIKLIAGQGIVLKDGRSIPFKDVTDVNCVAVGQEVSRKGLNCYVVIRTNGNSVPITGGMSEDNAAELAGNIINFTKSAMTLNTQNFVK